MIGNLFALGYIEYRVEEWYNYKNLWLMIQLAGDIMKLGVVKEIHKNLICKLTI